MMTASDEKANWFRQKAKHLEYSALQTNKLFILSEYFQGHIEVLYAMETHSHVLGNTFSANGYR